MKICKLCGHTICFYKNLSKEQFDFYSLPYSIFLKYLYSFCFCCCCYFVNSIIKLKKTFLLVIFIYNKNPSNTTFHLPSGTIILFTEIYYNVNIYNAIIVCLFWLFIKSKREIEKEKKN